MIRLGRSRTANKHPDRELLLSDPKFNMYINIYLKMNFIFINFYLIEERFALLAVASKSVVLAIVTDTTRDSSSRLIDSWIKVAPIRVMITVAAFASVRLTTNSRPPRKIVIEVFALLAVESLGVVRTFTSTVDHVWSRFHTW